MVGVWWLWGRVWCWLATTLMIVGCATEYNLATGREEAIYITDEREVQMGRNISEALEEKVELSDDPLLEGRVDRIGQRLAAVSDRKDIPYRFRVLAEDEVNAVALPGGFIYVYQGLVEKAENDDELAGVLAHEIGHVAAKHVAKRLQGSLGYTVLKVLMLAGRADARLHQGADLAYSQLLLAYSREDELEADRLAVKYMKAVGYDPDAMIHFLETLREVDREGPLRPKHYSRTHPYTGDRIRTVRQEIHGNIEFDDYLNTSGGDAF